MHQNNLTQRYQNYLDQPIQFMNNQMLNNNPIYASNIHDQNFYQQMMLQREEQMRKIRNVSDLNMTRDQITEYVIAPIKIERGDGGEIERYINEEEKMMTQKFIEDNWWSKRTNEPYKNILKDEDWRKDFKKEDDLIVHKVTDLDKVGLMDDYTALVDLIEVHNGELKVIFSSSKETEHKKTFKFVQKYKYRMKYDPKDYNDLKDYYKKEQKKFDREQKHIDTVISRLMDDDMDDKELKSIESDFLKPSKTKKKKTKDQNKDIDREIQEFIDEYGEDALDVLLEDSDDGNITSKKKTDKKYTKITKKKENIQYDNDSGENNEKHSRIRIKKKTIENTKKTRTKKDGFEDISKEVLTNVSVKTDTIKRIRIKRISKDDDVIVIEPTVLEPVNIPKKTLDFDKNIRIRIKPKEKSKAMLDNYSENIKSTKHVENTVDSSINQFRITRKPKNE